MKIKLGVRAHDLVSKQTPEDLAEALHQAGFSYVQLVFAKAFSEPSYDDAFVLRVKNAFDRYAIKIAMLGAYFNPVHSDPQKVRDGVRTFEENLRIAHVYGNPYVGSETGSFNDSPWIYVPKNQTEEGYQQSKQVFKELANYAEKVGGHLSIEGAWGHVMYCPKQLRRLVDELNSPAVDVTVDLYNYLNEQNFYKRDEIFDEALSLFKDKVKIIHLKDAKLVDGKLIQLAPGKGDFHYPYMLSEILKYCPEATLVFEGVKDSDIATSKAFIESLASSIKM
jgi:L-ribulose-5-phosphate 3-epimerase